MKKRIKILFCIDQLNIGGTEKQLLAIVERFDRKVFEPYLVCLQSTPYLEQCSVDCNKLVLDVDSLFSWKGIGKLFRFSHYLREEEIVIVQTFFFDSTVFGVLAAKLARVQKVISCRRDMGFWYTPKLLKVLRVVNLMTDRILVNSQAIKENVVEREHARSEKIDVLYNGINEALFAEKTDTVSLKSELGIPAGNKIVGMVANLNRQVKRVDLFIEIAGQILLRMKEQVSFVIVGEGHLRGQLERQAKELGIPDNIIFVGSQNNIVPYLNLFDIGVMTSESEGFANSIIEYMSAGISTVASDFGGTREIIQDGVNGFLVPVGDVVSFTGKICLLLEEEDIRLRMCNASRTVVSLDYSWGKKIKEVEAYYFDLLSYYSRV